MHTAFDPRTMHIERLVAAIDLPIGRWNAEARLVYCNEPYLAWSGRDRSQLLGRPMNELFGEAAWAAAEDAFVQAFRGRTVRYQRMLSHGKVAGRWARLQVFPDTAPDGRIDAVFTMAIDIHDDVMRRDALANAQRRLHHFADNIPCPVTYVDSDFVLRFVNKAYVEVSKEARERLLGQHIGLVRGAKRWAEHEPYYVRAKQGQTITYTRLVPGLPQGPRWLRTSYVPDRGADGVVQGIYTVTIDVHEMAVAQEKLKRRVERDGLTDVLSRRTMMDRIEAALHDTVESPVALFFVDLDGFKEVNDRLGHRQGDALLIAVGAALQAAVRPDDAVGRFGGDEFLVLTPVRDAAAAHALALHMMDAVRAATSAALLGEGLSASVGYALAPLDAHQPLALLQLADDAMYAAKRASRNCAMHCATLSFEATR